MRPEKVSIVKDIQHRLSQSSFLIVVGYAGMQVEHFYKLRKRLKAVNAKLHVVKNTLLLRAAQGLDFPEFGSELSGQNALITGNGDMCETAKVLRLFAIEFEKPVVKMGILDSAILSIAQVDFLANLPSYGALRAQLLSLCMAPARRLVCTFFEPGVSLVRLLQAKQSRETLPS